MVSFLTSKVLVANRADNVSGALNLMDEECLIVFEILVAESAVVVLRSGPLVAFDLSFSLEVSVTVGKAARDESGGLDSSHVVSVVDVEALCNFLGF